MSHTVRSEEMSAAQLATLSDDELRERVQRQTFRFFWEAGHPVSGLPPDRRPARTSIGVTGLAYDALVEIDLVVRRPPMELPQPEGSG